MDLTNYASQLYGEENYFKQFYVVIMGDITRKPLMPTLCGYSKMSVTGY